MTHRFITQEKEARKELRKNLRHFKSKRKTVLVRVQKKWLEPLRSRAKEKKKTMSKLHDQIYIGYFNEELDDS